MLKRVVTFQSCTVAPGLSAGCSIPTLAGFIKGAVGGWAGGEVGLWEVRENAVKEGLTEKEARSKGEAPVTKTGKGQDEIYVGFTNKEDGYGDRTGKKGRVIVDDARKYPAKEVSSAPPVQ